MKKFTFILFMSSLPWAGGMAQAEGSYLPFVEEGKSWVVTYWNHENRHSYKRTYTITGDTIIRGVQYKRLFEKDRNLYLYALREEEKKVYAIASTDKYGKPNTEELLWYDFNINEGDKLETERSWLYVTATDYVCIGGYKRRRIHIYQAYKIGPDEYNGSGVWVEGIGSDLGPDSPYAWGLDKGSDTIMEECSTSGHTVFTHGDFTAQAWSEETELEAPQASKSCLSAEAYDLQGRKTGNGRPNRGLSIHNGKKSLSR